MTTVGVHSNRGSAIRTFASSRLKSGALWHLARVQSERSYWKYLQKRLGPYFTEVDPGPAWTSEIVARTAALTEANVPEEPNRDAFLFSGYRVAKQYLQVLEQNGLNLRTVGSILELGCGSARVLRHFRSMQDVRLVGADVDASLVQWCKNNVPGAEFYLNELQPPLTFAKDASFDVAIAFSVFTHIPFENQEAWLQEMNRVLRPGGFLACSITGWWHRQKQLDDAGRQELQDNRRFTLTADDPRVSFSTRVIRHWDVFQTRDDVIASFGAYFEICDYLPGGQDLLILRKRA